MNGLGAAGLIAQANAEVRAAEQVHRQQKAEQQRLRGPIAMIDEMLNALEEMNLKRVSRVPLAYEPRLLQLKALVADTAVSPQQLDGLRTRVRITRLMEALFGVQEVLFAQLQPDAQREAENWDRDYAADDDDRPQVAITVFDESTPAVAGIEDGAPVQPFFSAA